MINYENLLTHAKTIITQSNLKGYTDPEILYGYNEIDHTYFIQISVDTHNENCEINLNLIKKCSKEDADLYATKLANDLVIPYEVF